MPTVAPLDLDSHCILAAFLADIPIFATADGTIHRLENGHTTKDIHDGLLCAAIDSKKQQILTGGEDGRVCRITASGEVSEIITLPRKWINAIASGPNGAVACAEGRNVHVILPKGDTKTLTHERSAEGIAFAPKGLRIAVARYNGATLHFPAADGKPAELEWAGAHTGISFSPGGEFLVTTMQENALHGWKLSDGKHMRMTGYPGKIKSWSWSAKGKWLATSGAPTAIVWPFQGKDGPMGKAPLELGTRGNTMVTAVSCHPTDDVVAIGYADGMILAARFSDSREVLLRRGGNGPVTSLDWDRQGYRIAFGAETGECGVIDIRA